MATASASTIKGLVQDKETKEPLVGALVYFENLDQYTQTDLQGYFKIEVEDSIQMKIKISYLGYENQDYSTTVSALPMIIELEPAKIDLPTVNVRPTISNEILIKVDQQLRSVSSSQDMLQLVPGLFIAQHAGGGKAEQLFLRGFDLDHGTDISIQIDGMPVNMVSHAHGQGYADLHFAIPELIQQIQYEKGPYTTQIGNLATAGAIQIKTPSKIKTNQVKATLGQFGWRRLYGQFKLIDQERHHWYVAGSGLLSDGYFESPQEMYANNFFTKYTYTGPSAQKISIAADHFSSQWNASGQIPERAVNSGLISRFGAIDDTEGGKTSRSNLNIQSTIPLKNGALLKNQIWASHYQFLLYSNFTFFATNPVNGDQIRQKENRWLAGSNNSLTIPYQLAGQQATFEVGLQYRIDQVDDVELSYTQYRTSTRERLAFGDVLERNLGLYLNHDWHIAERFLLNVGLRYDQFHFDYQDQLETVNNSQGIVKSIFSPKLQLNYKATDWLQLYSKLGKGFHSNDARVVIQQNGLQVLPAAWGMDFGAQIKPLPSLFIQTAYWQLWSDQEFVYVGDEAIVEAGAPSFRQGVDLSVRWQIKDYLFADTDLTFSKARSLESENEELFIPLAPIATATGGLTFQSKNGWEGSFRSRYLSDRPANEDYSITAAGYWVNDLTVAYKINNWRIEFFVQNLFNVEWNETQFETTSRLRNEPEPISEIHFTPGTPRNFRVQLAINF